MKRSKRGRKSRHHTSKRQGNSRKKRRGGSRVHKRSTRRYRGYVNESFFAYPSWYDFIRKYNDHVYQPSDEVELMRIVRSIKSDQYMDLKNFFISNLERWFKDKIENQMCSWLTNYVADDEREYVAFGDDPSVVFKPFHSMYDPLDVHVDPNAVDPEPPSTEAPVVVSRFKFNNLPPIPEPRPIEYDKFYVDAELQADYKTTYEELHRLLNIFIRDLRYWNEVRKRRVVDIFKARIRRHKSS